MQVRSRIVRLPPLSVVENSGGRIETKDQLPVDPLQMPPPHWRGSGAIFHLEAALEDLVEFLRDLIPLHAATEARLSEHYDRFPEPNEENEVELEEFSEICDDLWDHEHQIRLKSELASLMGAIEAEDQLNRFCVYNLHRDIAESIERLSPPEKLLIASASVGASSSKGGSVLEATKKLSTWRNAFVHGHCVDRPTKSLRHNPLIHPENFPGVLEALATMRELVGAYLRISDCLCRISKNPYTAAASGNVENIRKLLNEVSSYKFAGNSYVYDVTLNEASLQSIAHQLQMLAESHEDAQRAKLEDLLAALEPRDARVLRLSLGLSGLPSHSDEEVSALLGIPKREIAGVRSAALVRLSTAGLDEPAV